MAVVDPVVLVLPKSAKQPLRLRSSFCIFANLSGPTSNGLGMATGSFGDSLPPDHDTAATSSLQTGSVLSLQCIQSSIRSSGLSTRWLFWHHPALHIRVLFSASSQVCQALGFEIMILCCGQIAQIFKTSLLQKYRKLLVTSAQKLFPDDPVFQGVICPFDFGQFFAIVKITKQSACELTSCFAIFRFRLSELDSVTLFGIPEPLK